MSQVWHSEMHCLSVCDFGTNHYTLVMKCFRKNAQLVWRGFQAFNPALKTIFGNVGSENLILQPWTKCGLRTARERGRLLMWRVSSGFVLDLGLNIGVMALLTALHAHAVSLHCKMVNESRLNIFSLAFRSRCAINPFNASCSKLLLFKRSCSAILV